MRVAATFRAYGGHLGSIGMKKNWNTKMAIQRKNLKFYTTLELAKAYS
jgi:hypothetical protein